MRIPKTVCAAIILACGAWSVAAHAESPRWEPVETVQTDAHDYGSAAQDGLETEARDGYIYVRTTRPVTVKVFTILGQLVARGNLPAGTSRLKVDGRGIFILKTDTATKRITL